MTLRYHLRSDKRICLLLSEIAKNLVVRRLRCGCIRIKTECFYIREKLFKVLRVGSDVRIVCTGCGRDMTVDRIKLEKSIKNVIV